MSNDHEVVWRLAIFVLKAYGETYVDIRDWVGGRLPKTTYYKHFKDADPFWYQHDLPYENPRSGRKRKFDELQEKESSYNF